jgi:RHH-type transcriptional regulator, rel operon repressor / antitoxin RelB
MSAISLRLPDEISQRIEALSKKTGRTKNFYLLKAIVDNIDELEDLYLAEQSLIDVRAGLSKTYTLEEVEKDLDLED